MPVTRSATTPLGPIPVVVMQDTGWPQMGGTVQVCLCVCCNEVTFIIDWCCCFKKIHRWSYGFVYLTG